MKKIAIGLTFILIILSLVGCDLVQGHIDFLVSQPNGSDECSSMQESECSSNTNDSEAPRDIPVEDAEEFNEAKINCLQGSSFSRKANGEIINSSGEKYAYFIDENNILTYVIDGEEIKTDITVFKTEDRKEPSENTVGMFISSEVCAFAYQDLTEPSNAFVLTRQVDDEAWQAGYIENSGEIVWMKIGYIAKDTGWILLALDGGTGTDTHVLYWTDDAGEQWTSVNITCDDVYKGVMSGAAFFSKDVGYITYRYDSSPMILKTQDGGNTWAALALNVPHEYMNCSITLLSPYIVNGIVYFPANIVQEDGSEALVDFVMNEAEELVLLYKE